MSPILDPHSLECPSHTSDQTRRLGVRLGESMESDFVATVVLARWAGQRTEWLEDFERGRRFM